MTAYPIETGTGTLALRASELKAQLWTKPFEIDSLVVLLVRSGLVQLLPGMTELHGAILGIANDYALNPQEIRVVAGLASGIRRAELSTRLGLNENTVKWQIRQVLAKTSTTTTTQLMALVVSSIARATSLSERRE